MLGLAIDIGGRKPEDPSYTRINIE